MRCKKNWNILWRLEILLLVFVFFGCGDNEEKLYGSWRLQSVKMNGEALDDTLQYNVIPKYTFYTFFYANALIVQTYAMEQDIITSDGSYAFKNNSTIYMRFTLFDKLYDISDAKIKKLTRRELNLEYTYRDNDYFLIFYSY